MMLKQKVIDHHGRINDICLYDCEPSKEDLEALKQARLEALQPKKQESDEENERKDDDDDGPVNKSKPEKKKAEEVQPQRPLIKCYDKDSQYLYEAFEEIGYATKKEAHENQKTVYYNYTPHDKNDPVLLTLFTSERRHQNWQWQDADKKGEKWTTLLNLSPIIYL